MTTITSTEAGATGRYINLGSNASQDDTGPQTTIVYCRPTAIPASGYSYLIAKVGNDTTNGPRVYLTSNAGAPYASFGATSASLGYPVRNGSANDIVLNNWQYIETTWTGELTYATIHIYINGAESSYTYGPASGTTAIASDGANDLYLLNRPSASTISREFIGDMAYIARWNRVLTTQERLDAKTNGPLSVPTGLILCWANGQDYGPYALAPVSRSTFVAGANPPNTALGDVADTTAPTLSNPTCTATGATTASGGVSTDEANGTLYWLASTNATELLATVKSGSSQAVTTTGAQSVLVTGLTASTGYYLHYAHTDAAANDSTVVNSALFSTYASGPMAPPTLYSTRAHVVNVGTGQPYYVKNANTTDTIPASITKMMTCYTLLQHKTYAELENTVTVISADLQAGSGANLLAGDVISYRQLIADAMLPSSNAACAVIARSIGQMLLDIESGGVGDSFVRFMAEMNTVSDAIGMTDSTWYNPSGLNGPDYTPPTLTNITTPSDMNRVMGLLWAYPVMAQVWNGGSQFYDMPLTRSGSPTSIQIENVHGLRADAGVIGGKTGTTSVANSCALWQAPSGDVVAITVFNGGVDGRYTDSRAIITQLPIDFPELAVGGETYTLAADSASLTLDGQDVGLIAGRRIAADSVAMTMADQDTSLVSSRSLVADTSSLSIVGQDASLIASCMLVADSSAITLTGQDATLTYMTVSGSTYTLSASSSAMILEYQDAALISGRRLSADSAAFELAVQDAILSYGYVMAAASGDFSLAGQDSALIASRRLAVESSAMTLAGQDATPTYSGEVFTSSGFGAYSVPPHDIRYSIQPADMRYSVAPQNINYSITR